MLARGDVSFASAAPASKPPSRTRRKISTIPPPATWRGAGVGGVGPGAGLHLGPVLLDAAAALLPVLELLALRERARGGLRAAVGRPRLPAGAEDGLAPRRKARHVGLDDP